MGTVFAGDEIVAIAEQGDWLQVKLYYFGEEEEEEEDGKDIDEEDEQGDEEDDEEEDEEQGVTLVWAQRRTPDGRELLIAGPCPDTDLLRGGRADALSDSMDSINEEDSQFQRLVRREMASKASREVEAQFRIVEGAEVAVRRGMEPMAAIVGMLSSGVITSVEETIDSRGLSRLRITHPLRGWVAKLPGVLEEIETGAETKEGELGSGELSEEKSFDLLEDNLETEVGQDLFRKEERYFAGRHHGGSSTRMYHQLYGYQAQDNGMGLNKGNKRLRFFGQNSVQAVWQGLATLSAQELDKRLREKMQMMVTLHARQVTLALLLHWRESLSLRLGAHVTPTTRSQLAPLFVECISSGDGSQEEKSADHPTDTLPVLLEKFIRLLSFRGFSESGWEGKFARFWGSSYASLFEDNSCLDLIPHMLRTLPALMSPVIQAILLSCDEKGSRTTLARELEDELMRSITHQLQSAASPVYADVSWDHPTFQQDDDDKDALAQPSIHLVRWLSRILYETCRDARSWALNGPTGTSHPPTVLRLFRAWSSSMKSPGLSLKLQAASELGYMLADVVTALSANESEGSGGATSTTKAADLRRLLGQMLTVLPAKRLRRLTANRLGLENEDAPMYSRFLQALIELVTFMDLASEQLGKNGMAASTAQATAAVLVTEEDKAISSAESEGDGGMITRPVLKFSCGEGSHILMEASREWLDPPWTAEFWVYRSKEAVAPSSEAIEDTSSSMQEPEALELPIVPPPPRASSSRGRGGRRVAPSTFLSALTDSIPEPPPLPGSGEATASSSSSTQPPRSSSASLGPPPQLVRTRSTGGPESSTGTIGGISQGTQSDLGSEGKETTTLSTEDEFLLLHAEDFPSLNLNTTREVFRPSTGRGFGSGGLAQRSVSESRRGRSGRLPGRLFSGWEERGAMGKNEGNASVTKSQGEKKSLPSMYLARSSTYAIKLQAGGRIIGLETKDDEEPVPEQAHCLAVSVCGEPDRAFDYVVPTQQWVHLVFIAKKSPRSPKLTLMADGEVVGTIPVKLGLPLQMVGGLSPESFSGYLAQVRYWNYDRSSEEIRRDMRCEVSEATSGLLACWTLNEGRGSYVGESTNTFRSCTARSCEWEEKMAPIFAPSPTTIKENEDLLYPKEEIGDEGEEAARVMELSGWFERDAVVGVDGQWCSSWKEPFVLRYHVDSVHEGPSSTNPAAVRGVVEWPEKRLKALVGGPLSSDGRLEVKVTHLLEGDPLTHGWIVGLRFTGSVKDCGREVDVSWEVMTDLVRKKSLGPGEMRIDAGTLIDEVTVSEEGMAVSRSDGGGSRSGCLVTV